MLLVNAHPAPSRIHGIGLFAAEPIPKGTVVWRFDPRFDQQFITIAIVPDEVESISPVFKKAVLKYGYVNPANKDYTILCCDDARFMNFATPTYEANLELGPKYCGEETLLAKADIGIGEEITVPLDSDADARRKLSSI